MKKHNTLVEVLHSHTKTKANELLYRYIEDESLEPITLSFLEVDTQARAIANTLLKTCKKGDRALMLYPAGLEFMTAFLGCLYAGVIAVPAYPPRKNQKISRLKSIIADADASIIMTVHKSAIVGQPLFDKEETLSTLPWFITDRDPLDSSESIDVNVMPDDIAFLQYTSGSTGEPKGVMVTHKNIMSNMEYMFQCYSADINPVSVSWLPHFHDMGLMGGVLQPLYSGSSITFMAPAYCLQKPIRWLEAITKYKATITGGPNFAYNLCVDNISDDELDGIDLSSLEVAVNGAEPILASTLKRFSEKFERCGFKHRAHYPCYGMAETTLIISGGKREDTAKVLNVNKKQLQAGKIVKDTNVQTSQEMISSGFTWLEHELLLVNPKTFEKVAENEVGEVWARGDSVTQGYWKNPEKTREAFEAYTIDGSGPYLRTGDLAFYYENEIFICGRNKDLLIIRGKNFYPQDIEGVVSLCSESLSSIGAAVFSVEVDSEEQLVIAQEVKRTEIRKFNKEEVFKRIKEVVFESFELKVYDIVLLKPGQLLKTSSGKVQRGNNKHSYENNLYQKIGSLRDGSITKEKDENTLVLESFSYEKFKTLSEDKKTLYVYQLIRYDVATLLGVGASTISADDSLLSIGLDSLDMMRLLSSLEKRYLFKIDIDVLFELSNLGELVHLIVQNLEKNLDEEESLALHCDLVKDEKNRFEPFELDEIQQAYALGRSKDVVLGNTACFVYAEFISQKIDIVRLEDAWNKVIKRHDMLRCVMDEQMNQRVLEEVPRYKISFDASKSNLLEKRDEKLSKTLDPSVWPLFSLDVSILENSKVQTNFYIDMLICDASSIYILLNDLNHYYNDKKDLPALEVSYRDYLSYEQQLHAMNKHERSVEYWNDRIKNLPMGPSLPLAVLTSSIEKPHFSRRTFKLEATQWESVQNKANELHITPTVLLLSLFSKVLAFWSNEENFCLNLTLFKRDGVHEDVEKLVGDFTSLIPLEMHVTKHKSLKLLFKEVQKQLLSDLTHTDVSGVEIIREMRSHGIEGSMPVVFTSLLGLDDKLESCLGKTAFTISQTPQVWIDNQVSQEDGKLVINWDCLDELLNEHLVNDMFEAYENLIHAFIEDKHEKMCLLPSKQVVAREKYNDTRKDVDKTLLPQSFMNAAFIHNDALALVDSTSRLTYQQTHNTAVKIASYIQEKNLRKDEHVAILLPKGVEQVLAVLGCGYAGIPYLPLSIDLPKERILYLLEEASVTCILSEKSLLSSYEIEGTDISDLISYDSKVLHFEVQAKADDLAYTIFTSGSTGKPKGVMTTHKSVANTVHDMNEHFNITSKDKLFGISALNFDLSVFDIYGALSVGATLVVANEDERKDSAAWLRWIEDENITVWNSVPALVDLLCDEGQIPSSLRLFLMSGDFISVDLVKKINTLSKAEIISLGGATEAAIWSIYYPVVHTNMHKIPYGYPLANQEIHILDEDLNTCADFVHGDIYIKGLGLARGYLNDAEKTTASFINKDNEIFYKTGDIGYFSEKAYVEIIGRSDDQVKIQGYRIELGEIEEELLHMPEVQHCVVLVKEDHNKYKTLVAFLVSDEDLSLATVKEALSLNLPDYMIPRSIKTLDEIPLTGNGKIDKKALLSLDIELVKHDFVKASGMMQEYLADCFCEVLNVADIGIHDNFFELGGNSLSATKLVSKIRLEKEIDLAIKELFLNPSVGALATVIENDCKKMEIQTIHKLENRERPALSFAQERIWFLDQYEESNTIYQMPGLLSLKGKLNVDALGKALVSIVERHEILRTNFAVHNDVAYQKIQDSSGFSFETFETSKEKMYETVHASLDTSFDLSKDSLFRVSLYKISEKENYLFINMHHIISDGWSLAVLVNEFVAIYSAYLKDEANPLPELDIQYADFSAWQNEQLVAESLDEKMAYWKEELDGLTTLALPTSYPRASVQSTKGKRKAFEINESITAGLQTLSKENDTTLNMTLLSAFSVLLHRYAGQDDIAIGTPIAARNHVQIENLIGFFVNTLVLRHDYSTKPNFTELLAQVKDNSIHAFEHQEMPFEKLVDTLNVNRDSAYSPLVQVLFVFQNNEKAVFDLPELSISIEELDNGTAKFDLAMVVHEEDAHLSVSIEYASDLFSEAYISSLTQNFLVLLSNITKDAQAKVSSFNLLTQEETTQQLVTLNETAFAYDKTQTVHGLFESKAQEFPQSKALVFEETVLTYQELNEKSNQLASYLREQGIEKDDLVAICLERSAEMIVSLLAVLKAGGAYLPVDPSYPNERISYMLEDSKSKILITQDSFENNYELEDTKVLILDSLNLSVYDKANLNNITTRHDMAYVIYTSGSTGRPKGVMVEHGGVVNLSHDQGSSFNLSQDDRVLQFASFGFDAASWEIVMALLQGACLYLCKQSLVSDASALEAFIINEKISIATIPPVMLNLLNSEKMNELKTLVSAGEACSFNLVQNFAKNRRFFNAYGPTESSVCASMYLCSTEDTKMPPIGKAIKNTQLYILDTNNGLVPKGVPGELHIAGDGLARGYLHRPDLSVEKFIDNPFTANTKLYKTGDIVRYLEDGNIEYLGRIDDQVKIRGFRIELSEIESLVNEIAGVSNSVALVSKSEHPTIQLFCEKNVDEENDVVVDNVWEDMFEEKYEGETEDQSFDVFGWKSSYTQDDIPEEQMQRWVHSTVDIILGTGGKNVFEIGCGSGLLLHKLYPELEHYFGIDISSNTIAKLDASLKKQGVDNVQVACATADSFVVPTDVKVDTVVINSVIQYFPNSSYLDNVIENSIKALTEDTGSIVIGDVLNLRLQEEFYYSIIKFNETTEFSLQALIEMIDTKKLGEEELFVDPSYFVSLKTKLSSIKDIKISLKKDLDHNEMNNFRFDVILDIDKVNTSVVEMQPCEVFEANASLDVMMENIQNSTSEVVKIISVLNKRTAADKNIKELKEANLDINTDAFYVADLYAKLSSLSFDFVISPAVDNRFVDIIVNKTQMNINYLDYASYSDEKFTLTNNPSLASSYLINNIKKRIAAYLPEYMMPSRIKIMEGIPLTPNAKVDKKALLAIGSESHSSTEYVAPQNETQETLAAIFSNILNLDKVGIHDNFFELGGNSILTVQLVSLVKEEGLYMEVKDIFQAQTIADLDVHISSERVEVKIDLDEEAFLEEEIKGLQKDEADYTSSDVLLTGATGFVGRYLLAEIFEKSEDDVYCVVRAKSVEEGFKRIKKSLCEYKLWKASYEKRLHVVIGDLAEKNLGIQEDIYKNLCEKIVKVYHSATYMNHLASYEYLKDVNVGGLKELLRFSSTSRAKKIEYISTIAVLNDTSVETLDEVSSLHNQTHYKSSGYAATKYVAEEICLVAQQRGIDINIYRLGLITGDFITGKNDESQWFQQLLEAGMTLTSFFHIEGFEIPVTPVDFVVASIYALANSKHKNEVFHISNDKPLGLGDLHYLYNKIGEELSYVSLSEFIQRLKTYNANNAPLTITTFLMKYFDYDEGAFLALEKEALKQKSTLSMAITLESLQDLGIEFPEISSELIQKYFKASFPGHIELKEGLSQTKTSEDTCS